MKLKPQPPPARYRSVAREITNFIFRLLIFLLAVNGLIEFLKDIL